MKYYFSDFVLDTEIKELHHLDQPVILTKQSYTLLNYLLENNHKIHTKDELVTQVWQGRIVSDNTIDQSVSKLRKVLNDHQAGQYIEAIYGQGIKFLPQVSEQVAPTQQSRINVLALSALLVALVLMVWFVYPGKELPTNKPHVIVLQGGAEGSWIQAGTEQLLSHMINYSGLATVVDLDSKPRFVDNAQFIKNQKQFNAGLHTIQSTVVEEAGSYQLSISISQSDFDASEVFKGMDLSLLMSQAMEWVGSQINSKSNPTQPSSWLPPSDHVAELYLRAMESLQNNEFEKSRKQLDLITEEAPEFYLAKLQLAQVLSIENKHDESLAILNTLLHLPVNDEFKIASVSLKAYIYDTLGRYDEAIALFDELFELYMNSNSLTLLKARYEYSVVLVNTNQAEKASQQLDQVIAHLTESENATLLADVRALKGSLLQRMGQVEAAKIQLSAALDLFERNDDALGSARTFSALARIANHQANYTLAESYLNESLAITREVGFKLGEGATLNELAYVLMVQGQFRKAIKLVKELDQIASEIEYPAMQMAAKQLFFDMAREQGDWTTAERHLQQHMTIASETNNARAKIKNTMLELSLRVDAGELDKTTVLVDHLQQHIEQQNENRMQPRLDWLKARIKWQQGNLQQAHDLIIAAKTLAHTNEDGETLIKINNLLAEMYLTENKPEEALAVLNDSLQFKPFALPYLKLKAQALEAMGEPIKALEIMNLCQQQAADLWTQEDSVYLKQLIADAQP